MLDRGLVLGAHVPRHRRQLPFGRNAPVPSWPGAIACPTVLRWRVDVGPDRSGRRFPLSNPLAIGWVPESGHRKSRS